MSLKLDVTQIGMSLKLDYHSNWSITQSGMSLKLEFYSNWNFSQIGTSLKLERHSNGMSLKNFNVTPIIQLNILKRL